MRGRAEGRGREDAGCAELRPSPTFARFGSQGLNGEQERLKWEDKLVQRQSAVERQATEQQRDLQVTPVTYVAHVYSCNDRAAAHLASTACDHHHPRSGVCPVHAGVSPEP